MSSMQAGRQGIACLAAQCPWVAASASCLLELPWHQQAHVAVPLAAAGQPVRWVAGLWYVCVVWRGQEGVSVQ
jgi:hypothetical protein